MKAMKYVKAAGSFCQTLFGRSIKTSGMSPSGFPVMQGWKTAPEEAWLAQGRQARAAVSNPRYALFCFQGTHSGEVFFIANQLSIGSHANNSIVLTAPHEGEAAVFQMETQPMPRLRSQSGSPFSLNGRAVVEAELFDYDELDIFGSRFLMLDLFNESSRGSQ